jgi:hypothetical protein
MCEQEEQLTNFLENLNISKGIRSVCRVDEDKLEKWQVKA